MLHYTDILKGLQLQIALFYILFLAFTSKSLLISSHCNEKGKGLGFYYLNIYSIEKQRLHYILQHKLLKLCDTIKYTAILIMG